eukprot:1194934-Prorocentrum_minimum.AAC.4
MKSHLGYHRSNELAELLADAGGESGVCACVRMQADFPASLPRSGGGHTPLDLSALPSTHSLPSLDCPFLTTPPVSSQGPPDPPSAAATPDRLSSAAPPDGASGPIADPTVRAPEKPNAHGGGLAVSAAGDVAAADGALETTAASRGVTSAASLHARAGRSSGVGEEDVDTAMALLDGVGLSCGAEDDALDYFHLFGSNGGDSGGAGGESGLPSNFSEALARMRSPLPPRRAPGDRLGTPAAASNVERRGGGALEAGELSRPGPRKRPHLTDERRSSLRHLEEGGVLGRVLDSGSGLDSEAPAKRKAEGAPEAATEAALLAGRPAGAGETPADL